MRKTHHRFLLAILLSLAAITVPAQQASMDGKQQYAALGTCNLVSGKQITGCFIGYRTWGKLNAQHSNAILFPTWFSGRSSNIAPSVGAESLVDPSKYFLIVVDALGDGVSSSPSTSTTQHGREFPAITIKDMVNAEYRLALEALHLTHLHAVMGISMGGMQTFEWMVDYPDFMDVAIPIVGSPRLTGYDLLLWYNEESALKSDPAWQGGRYTKSPPLGAVQAIHQMNLTTPADYARIHPPDKFLSDYVGYLTTGVLPFDANDWLAQLDAMIHHDVARGGKIEDAAKRVKAKVLVVAAAQDHMVNPKPALDFAALIGARTLVLDSDCGHLSNTCKAGIMNPAVRAFLDGK
jgi:homoserine O-acetyltransferase